jgi:hypothetical protein
MVLLELMLNQGEEWREFDEDIRERRESVRRERDPNEEVLAATVAAEVDFVYELWRGHFPGALERALAVMGELSGGQLESYRAWWNYLGGTAAWLQVQAGDTAAGARAVELFGAAARASKTISWFAELASSQRLEVDLEWDADALRAAERAQEELARLGYNGPGLTRRLEEARELLDAPEAGKFEQGLEKLGLLLGLDARRPAERGAPDGVWLVSDQLAFVLETKSEEHEAGAIGTRTVQQAEGHLVWLHEEGLVHDDACMRCSSLPAWRAQRTRFRT